MSQKKKNNTRVIEITYKVNDASLKKSIPQLEKVERLLKSIKKLLK